MLEAKRTRGGRAVSLDLDGAVIERYTEVQWGSGKSYFLQPRNYNNLFVPKHTPISLQDRNPIDRHLSLGEEIELFLHGIRYVKPEAANLVKSMQDVDIFVNTGRPNHRRMVNTTVRTLDKGGLLPYVHPAMSFKPDDVSSDESKYWRIVELQEEGYTDITHYDDNARTVKRLAKVLPNVRFVILQDLTSGLLFSREEMKKYPNVARIGVKRNGDIEVVYMPSAFGKLSHAT